MKMNFNYLYLLCFILINVLQVLSKNIPNGMKCEPPFWAEFGCIIFKTPKHRDRWNDCNFDCMNEPDYLCAQACIYEKNCGCWEF